MESPPGASIRVVIVAAQSLFRSGLRAMLEREGIEVAAEAETGAEAFDLVAALNPGVVLLDQELPDLPGREVIVRLAERVPSARVIALTTGADPDEVIDALEAGAYGYLPKDESIQELVAGIVKAAVAGWPLLSERTARTLIERLRELHAGHAHADAIRTALSQRELEVLALIVEGMDNAGIATALFISPDTVKHHVHNILDKLGVDNRLQAAVLAVRAGLL